MIYGWLVGIVVAVSGTIAALAAKKYKFGPYLEEKQDIATYTITPSTAASTIVSVSYTKTSQYLWDTIQTAYHSVRLICDEEGLTVDQKNTLTATIWGESAFNTKITHPNYAFKNGVKYVSSTDFGICQWNDFWHGKEISPTDAISNPEKAVRLMCTYWKRGQMKQWCAYSNGRYKLFLNKKP